MAVVQNPITGRSSGKFAGAIFSKWKNKNVLRSKPIEVNNPDTPAQQQRRSMFAFLVDIGRLSRPLIEVGFLTFKSVETWMNSFIKYNSNTFVQPGVAPAFTVDWDQLVLAKGSLTATDILGAITSDGTPTVQINYPDVVSAIDQSPLDLAFAFVRNMTNEQANGVFGDDLRSAGTTTVTLDTNNTSGDVINIYLFFQAANGASVSDSILLTVTVP